MKSSVILGSVLLATALVYAPMLDAPFNLIDDLDTIVFNPWVQEGFTLDTLVWAFRWDATSEEFRTSHWMPLTWLSHMWDCLWFGPWSGGHYLTNIALHLLTTCLLWLACRRLHPSLWVASIVAALFALHPFRVEAVAWVTQRKEILAAFFGAFALYAYARQTEGDEREPLRWRLLVWAAFLLSVCSKPSWITLPALLVLLDYWPRSRFSRATVREKLPLMLVVALSCAVTLHVSAATEGDGNIFNRLPLTDRLANAAISYVDYLHTTVWPEQLAFFYPHPGANVYMTWAVACAVFLAAGTGVLWMHRARVPWLLVGWLWFLGSLVPMIGILQLGMAARADRFMTLPIIGLGLALGGVMARYVPILAKPRQTVCAGLFAAAALALAWQSTTQVALWKDPELLYRHALATTRNNHFAHSMLAIYLVDRGREVLGPSGADPEHVARAQRLFQEAVLHFEADRRAIYYRNIPRPMASAYLDLGTTYAMQRRLTEAIEHFDRARHIDPTFEAAQRYYEHAAAGLGVSVSGRP